MEDKVYVYHGLYILVLVRGNWRKEFMLNQIFWQNLSKIIIFLLFCSFSILIYNWNEMLYTFKMQLFCNSKISLSFLRNYNQFDHIHGLPSLPYKGWNSRLIYKIYVFYSLFYAIVNLFEVNKLLKVLIHLRKTLFKLGIVFL